jgi:hypothetical protein
LADALSGARMMIWIPLVVTSVVVGIALKLWAFGRANRADLGYMSEQWIAECQASQPTSSM